MALTFVVPRPSAPSGGHAYNEAVVAHWPGRRPALVQLEGPWPRGDGPALQRLSAALTTSDVVLLDGLVGAAAPGLLADAADRGVRVVLVVHLPLAAEGGLSEGDRRELAELERRSVRAAWRVVATSRTAASDLARSAGRDDIVAVPPGVEPAPAAEPHDPPGLLQVGSIGPRKNQLTTLAALAGCLQLPWTATFAGPAVDDDYARQCRAAPGAERVTWAGTLHGDALAAAYASADLLLHPARAETWGMVVTDALARGIPAIVGAGTGAVEALGSGPGDALPGAAVPADDAAAMTRLLRRWLTDRALRADWRARALLARTALRGWPEAAAELARAAGGR